MVGWFGFCFFARRALCSMYRKNKVSEILIIDLNWEALARRASCSCQAENQARNCNLEAAEDKSWRKMRPKGRTCPVGLPT